MKIFPKIIQSTLLVTTPTFAAQPGDLPSVAHHKTFQTPDLHTLSYDEVVDILALIESDSFEEHYSIDELDRINQFIAHLAMEGATDDEKIDVTNATAALFRKDDFQYALYSDHGYAARPAIYFANTQDILLCKSWFKKQWDQTRAFVKKHKTAIIIGAIIVVTAAVVIVAAVAISSSAAGAAAAGGLASAAASVPEGKPCSEPAESFTSALQSQVSSFKDTVAPEQFAAAPEANGISIEENGRIVGSLFAQKTLDAMTEHVQQRPFTSYGFNSEYPVRTADLAFSTDYASTYPTTTSDLNTLSYQARGNLALSSECYTQAVQDFGHAIALDPSNPVLYLERGIANFELGHYEHSIADYSQYIEKKGEPFSVTDFSLGFAKGVPKGVYESGKGSLLFLSDFIAHPVQTSRQVVDSLIELAALVKHDEFGVVAETLSPELHQLVTQWDDLPSDTRGELAGYALGKLGTDLMAPGAVAKVATKSLHSAKELAAICKNIHLAQETLVLETASGIGIPAKVSEIVEMGKKTAAIGEELGFSAKEMAQLQKAGKLETTVSNVCEQLAPSMKESFELFKRAQEFLKPYKEFMPESQARELIHQTGISTFPRPHGIPENFRVQISNKGAGIIYVHPNHTHTSIRVMPGKLHSPLPYQQKPYVIHKKNGEVLDKFGNKLHNGELPEAHIPYEEFVYGG